MKIGSAALALGLVLASQVNALVPAGSKPAFSPHPNLGIGAKTRPSALWGSRDDDTISQVAASKKKTGIEEGVRNKLVAESIAPWRSLRLFLYFALGSGAFVGSLITLSGVAAGVSGAKGELDLNAEYLNLAIDFGAAVAFGVLAKLDFDKGAELKDAVEDKIERKKAQSKVVKSMREREKNLMKLMLDVQVSIDGNRTAAAVEGLQKGAKQHMIVVVGPRKACRDALVGANLNNMDFAMNNVLVVPYETDVGMAEKQMKPSGGFGEKATFETQPYIARPTGEGWEEYVNAELDDAIAQGGEKVREDGIAIVVANNGKVIRRGVGKVPWRQIVEQLEDEVRQVPKDEGINLDIPFL